MRGAESPAMPLKWVLGRVHSSQYSFLQASSSSDELFPASRLGLRLGLRQVTQQIKRGVIMRIPAPRIWGRLWETKVVGGVPAPRLCTLDAAAMVTVK